MAERKMTYYLLFLSVLIILFHFGGLIADSPISFLLDSLLDPENLRTSSLGVKIFSITTIIGVAAVTITSVFTRRPELVFKAPIGGFLLLIGWDMVSLWVILENVTGAFFATLFWAPLLLIYLISVVEWVTGA